MPSQNDIPSFAVRPKLIQIIDSTMPPSRRKVKTRNTKDGRNAPFDGRKKTPAERHQRHITRLEALMVSAKINQENAQKAIQDIDLACKEMTQSCSESTAPTSLEILSRYTGECAAIQAQHGHILENAKHLYKTLSDRKERMQQIE
jgi:hypothetical protein